MNSAEQHIDMLIQAMTLEEKVSLLAGESSWTTTPIERLGIPAIKMTDGPNGARGSGPFSGGNSSACFPAGIALASTWNPALIELVGQALGQEARTKGASLLLAPTVNTHRSVLNGRNFECYSEDPYLSARIAVAYINGVQSEGVGATVKHFVCNDSEFERMSISSVVDERTLREIYLPPFEAAVQEAGTWAVMSAYNKINGVYASENRHTLIEILKDEWGFDGIVMSDWSGTYSTEEAAQNGLDLEMPGPSNWRADKLVQAVEDGEVTLEAIDDSARRMLRMIMRSGRFEQPEFHEEQALDRPEHKQIARQAATEGIVLLKNDRGVLPLSPVVNQAWVNLKKIAVIGPNAKYAQIMGGGSAQVNPHYSITPWEGIYSKVGDSVEIEYQIGCTNHKSLPRLDLNTLTLVEGEGFGLNVEYYNNLDLSGEVVAHGAVRNTEHFWSGDIAPGVSSEGFSARLIGEFTPQESGFYSLGLASSGLCRLYIDGELVLDNWSYQKPGEGVVRLGSSEISTQLQVEAGEVYEIRLEYSSQSASQHAGFRLGGLPPVAENSIELAAQLASECDAALVFVGLNNEWESEGHDRLDMDLVGDQDALVEAVAEANSNTIVVLQSGSPIAMPWIEKVAAVMQAWYPGQECGNAIADILFGDVNPSGRLPQTYPKRLEDNPAYINYPGENGRVRYGEGLYVGYRYYEKKDIKPLFPFGYGLSYTSFIYGNLRLSERVFNIQDGLQVLVDIFNSGKIAGQEVVQLYIRDISSSLSRPEKELKAFAKVYLEPGETQTISLNLDLRSLAFYDEARSAWVAEAGDFEVLVGSSSTDIRAKANFILEDTHLIGVRSEKIGSPLNLDMTLKELLEHDGARAVLEENFPGMLEDPRLHLAMGMSLKQMAPFASEVFTNEKLKAVAARLSALSAE